MKNIVHLCVGGLSFLWLSTVGIVASAQPGITPAVRAQISDQTGAVKSIERQTTTNPPSSTLNDPFLAAIEKSFQLEAALQYPAAISALEPYSADNEHSYFLSMRVAWLHYLHGDYQKAINYYDKAIRTSPAATEARVGQLLPLLAQLRYDDAIVAATELLQRDPHNYFGNLRLAYAYRMQGEFAKAEAIDLSVLERLPTDLTFLAELGLTYLAQNRPEVANEVFKSMLVLDPNNALARKQLGLPVAEPAASSAPVVLPEPAESSLAIPAPATWHSGFIPSLAGLKYGLNSLKKNGVSLGLYGYVSKENMLEGAIDYTHLKFRDGTTLDQEDYTLIYSHLTVPNWKFRCGGHGIGSTDDFGNGSWYVMSGVSYYQTEVWDAGIDAFYSHYQNNAFSLDVNQLTPHVAVEHRFESGPKLRLETLGYYIGVGSEIGLSSTNFYSLETRLRLDHTCWSLAGYAWTGRQSYAVRRDGFVVFNLNEEHRGGYGGELSYRFEDQSWFTLRMTKELFADFNTGLGTHQFVLAGLWSKNY